MSAVIFVASEILSLENDRWWQDALASVLHCSAARHLLTQELLALGHCSGPSGDISDRQLTAALAAVPETKRFEILACVIDLVSLPRQMLRRIDLLNFEKECIELGAHGHTHAPLTNVEDPEYELRKSYQELQSLGANPMSMSFPHGAYSDCLVDTAKRIGFKFVFSSDTTLTPTDRALSEFPTLGRIHLPENRWTCRHGHISFPLMATFLFFRQVAG